MQEQNDERLLRLKAWVNVVLGAGDWQWQALCNDASFRRYFRICSAHEQYVLMDAPPPQEDVRPFLAVADQLLGVGLHVPVVHHADVSQGFVVLSDLGDQTYLQALCARRDDAAYVDGLYMRALQVLGALARLPQASSGAAFPSFDPTLLESEWHLFEHWYLDQHLGRSAEIATHRKALDALFQTMSARVLEQPHCWVHRDFHSRNLMVLPDGGVGVLDFQDAVWGPVTYDVISLLRDAYIAWPAARVEAWLCAFHRSLPQLQDVTQAQWLCWTDWMTVQRHLKVLGIFARLALRDGKRQYLDDMPLVRQYVMAMVPKYPELAVLNALL